MTVLLYYLSKLSNLSCLVISGCDKVTSTGIASLAHLPIQRFGASNNANVNDSFFKAINKWRNLTVLDLDGCDNITDKGLAYLADLTKLVHLDIGNITRPSRITNAGLSHLANLTLLTDLNIQNARPITDGGLAHMSNLIRLKKLIIEDCNRITSKGFKHIIHLPIEELFINGIHIDKASLRVISKWRNLTILDISDYSEDCTSGPFTADNMRCLTSFTRLEELYISGDNGQPDAFVGCIPALSRLRLLDISGRFTLSDASIRYLSGFPKLQVLYVAPPHEKW